MLCAIGAMNVSQYISGGSMKSFIQELSERKYNEFDSYPLYSISGDYDDLNFHEFEEGSMYELNYDDDFFASLQINRFDDVLLFEFIKLGDDLGYYKDWSFKKFVSTMRTVVDSSDNMFVNNYDDSDDEFARAFFLTMTVSMEEFSNFFEAYLQLIKRCKDIIRITENRLNSIFWDEEFEKDEKLFCDVFLTRYFKSLGFDKVKYNHGNKEFGKDYILEIVNIFGDREYFAVQVKAGDLSGKAKGSIFEITNQIKMAFKVPYIDFYGKEIYISKMLVVFSGVISENAIQIIKSDIDNYMKPNIMFFDKKNLLSLKEL
jgi:hypothetical protein